MALSKCVASQYIINVDPDAKGFQYDVEIIFRRNDDATPIVLSKNNNNHFKKICRAVINNFIGIEDNVFAYDGKAILWTPKALKKDIEIEIPQLGFDEYLKTCFTDSDGKLYVRVTKTAEIDLPNFPNSMDSSFNENRIYRNFFELVISEYAIRQGNFIMQGPGCLVEKDELPFSDGLVYRKGHQKGVHIIQGDCKAEVAVAIDCCKKVMFPSNENFSKFIEKFLKNGLTYNDAEKLCRGLRLRILSNPKKVLYFKHFENAEEGYRAVMKGSENSFSLEELEIVADQGVPINSMPKRLKELALSSNIFKAHERKKYIQQQIEKLKLNNPISAAFGIDIETRMLEGSFKIHRPMNILIKDGEKIESDNNGTFRSDGSKYFKRGCYKKVFVLSNKNDYENTVEGVKKILKYATNQSYRQVTAMIKHEEFNTATNTLTPWVNAISKFKGNGNLVIAVDDTPESQSYLKFAEEISGVQTQHLKPSTISNVGFQTMQNIVQKLNVKMGGLNHTVQFSDKVCNLNLDSGEIFVLGADVCHPTGENYKGTTDEPSVVGLSGNYLDHPQAFANAFFFQDSRKELIDNDPLTYYVKKMLETSPRFKQIKTIVFIRDSVSEGQYSKVLEIEIAAIKKAAADLSINVEIIAFIITKNMNVRHFVEDNGFVRSMPPKSFITFGTRYNVEQFFMIAHRSFIGTAKSIMVSKIYDDIGIAIEEAQEFLLGLTYLHQITNSPISLPTPVSQADNIAQRGQTLYRKLLQCCPKRIPRHDDELKSIDYQSLTKLLSFNNEEIPTNRYNA